MADLSLSGVIEEIEKRGNERTKKSHLSQGAKEPLFGNTVISLKPIAKQLLKQDNTQEIALQLYETGNYDLMYLAGMIVDPLIMSKAQFNQWMEKAYFYMIGDYIVAVSLSETTIAQEVADEWIESELDLYVSAGYSTYSWQLSRLSDETFERKKLLEQLNHVKERIHEMPERTKYSMYYFLYNVGVSYIPLHKEALDIAKSIGEVEVVGANNKMKKYNAYDDIMKQVDKGRLGFKRRYVRC